MPDTSSAATFYGYQTDWTARNNLIAAYQNQPGMSDPLHYSDQRSLPVELSPDPAGHIRQLRQDGNVFELARYEDIEVIHARVMAQDAGAIGAVSDGWVQLHGQLLTAKQAVADHSDLLYHGDSRWTAWQSPAAEAFFARGPGAALKSLNDWQDAAAANARALNSVSAALPGIQARMSSLYRQYLDEMSAAEAAWNRFWSEGNRADQHMTTPELGSTAPYERQRYLDYLKAVQTGSLQNLSTNPYTELYRGGRPRNYSYEALLIENDLVVKYQDAMNTLLGEGRSTRYEGPTDAVVVDPAEIRRVLFPGGGPSGLTTPHPPLVTAPLPVLPLVPVAPLPSTPDPGAAPDPGGAPAQPTPPGTPGGLPEVPTSPGGLPVDVGTPGGLPSTGLLPGTAPAAPGLSRQLVTASELGTLPAPEATGLGANPGAPGLPPGAPGLPPAAPTGASRGLISRRPVPGLEAPPGLGRPTIGRQRRSGQSPDADSGQRRGVIGRSNSADEGGRPGLPQPPRQSRGRGSAARDDAAPWLADQFGGTAGSPPVAPVLSRRRGDQQTAPGPVEGVGTPAVLRAARPAEPAAPVRDQRVADWRPVAMAAMAVEPELAPVPESGPGVLDGSARADRLREWDKGSVWAQPPQSRETGAGSGVLSRQPAAEESVPRANRPERELAARNLTAPAPIAGTPPDTGRASEEQAFTVPSPGGPVLASQPRPEPTAGSG